MESFTTESGMELTDEQKAQYEQFFDTVFGAAKYTVGEAEKDDEGN